MTNQTRIESAVETVADIGSGFIIALLAWMLIVPLIYPELKTPATTGGGVTLIFTVISTTRKYFWRRFFANGFHLVVHALIKNLRRK